MDWHWIDLRFAQDQHEIAAEFALDWHKIWLTLDWDGLGLDWHRIGNRSASSKHWISSAGLASNWQQIGARLALYWHRIGIGLALGWPWIGTRLEWVGTWSAIDCSLIDIGLASDCYCAGLSSMRHGLARCRQSKMGSRLASDWSRIGALALHWRLDTGLAVIANLRQSSLDWIGVIGGRKSGVLYTHFWLCAGTS